MKKSIIFLLMSFLVFGNIFFISQNFILQKNLKNFKKVEKQIKLDRKFFEENLVLKNYSKTKFKLQEEGKKIVDNIRNLHKGPTLINLAFIDKDLCAGYIWNLTEKLWGKLSNYSIGLLNTKTGKVAQAREIPYFYEAFGGEIILDFSKKFSLEKKDFVEKIKLKDLQRFFANAFLEKSLFGDIGFLYKDTSYLSKLETWNYNSHITKNIGISKFDFVFQNIDNKKSNLENFLSNFSCSQNFKKYQKIFENYKFFLNSHEITFYNGDFYFIKNSLLGEKVNFKYLDKINYKDITLTHFFKGKSEVDSLLQITCRQDFFPINIISINSRMIEKM